MYKGHLLLFPSPRIKTLQASRDLNMWNETKESINYILRNNLAFKRVDSPLSFLESRALAFDWDALREPIDVRAVVVDHKVLVDPPEPPAAVGVELIGLPRGSGGGGGPPDLAGRGGRGPGAGSGLEVPVVCREGRFRPVRLDQASSRGPIISIPKAWVYLHGLVLGEGHTNWLCILEHSNRSVVHQEAENQEEGMSKHWVCHKVKSIRLTIQCFFFYFISRHDRYTAFSDTHIMCWGFQMTEYVWKFLVGSNHK